jgi:hypothetical protein
MRSEGATFRRAVNLSFAKFDSRMCALSTSLFTNCPWESLNVLFTKPINSDEHVILTSSRMYKPCRGVSRPVSAGGLGSPGSRPPTVQFAWISRPRGAYTCVWRPSGVSLKHAWYETDPVARPPGRYDTLSDSCQYVKDRKIWKRSYL